MSYDDSDMFDDDAESSEHTYLTFRVGDEEYAVPVHFVTEIVRLQKSYAVPDVPSYIRGVINLRGKVIPLLDVRARFGLAESQYSDRTVVVVLEVDDTSTGLLVDGVSEVVDLPPDTVDTTFNRRSNRQSAMVKGVGKREQRVTFILDIPALLDAPSARPALAAAA